MYNFEEDEIGFYADQFGRIDEILDARSTYTPTPYGEDEVVQEELKLFEAKVAAWKRARRLPLLRKIVKDLMAKKQASSVQQVPEAPVISDEQKRVDEEFFSTFLPLSS